MSAAGRPAVSVCIANYNGLELIDACLRSVLQQEFDFPVEIIVHDDASSDGSAAHIRSNYPNVVLIASDQNVGFCTANNRMAEAAHGEYLLLLNNDAELFPDALRALHDAAAAIGRPALLGLPQYDAAGGNLIDRGSLFDPFLNPMPNLDAQRADVGMIIGACLWIPRHLWRDIGGFPAWFHTLAEDMYLCCVARLWGYPVRVLAGSGFRHWVGKSLGGGKVTSSDRLSTSRTRRALSERNKTFVMCLCYPAPWLIALLPLHLLLLLTEGMLISLIKRDSGLWKTIYAPLLPALWRSRRLLLAGRGYVQKNRRRDARFASAFRPVLYKLAMLVKHGMPHIR
jgi:GT2 family glycosyltransferase